MEDTVDDERGNDSDVRHWFCRFEQRKMPIRKILRMLTNETLISQQLRLLFQIATPLLFQV